MRRKMFVAAAMSIAIGATACGGSSSSTPTGTNAKEPIKILVSAPLTGDSAESGQDLVHGAELAADYINSKGGIAAGPHKGAKIAINGIDDSGTTEGATTV